MRSTGAVGCGPPPATVALVLGSMVLALRRRPAAASPSGRSATPTRHQTFSLTAGDGYVSTPDGNSIYMWSYANSQRGFQLPGPTLCVTSGQLVTVVLHNTLPEPTSIVFPGQKGVKANGNPAQPQFDSGGSLTSMVQPARAGQRTVRLGDLHVHRRQPGHVPLRERHRRQQAGADGHVRRARSSDRRAPDTRSTTAADSAFTAGKEYVFLLSEVDPDVHLAVERSQPIDWSNYTARYFMINGRSMPDTLAPNNASWLPDPALPAFVHIKPYDAVDQPAAGHHPLSQRGHGQLPVPPARQRRAGDQPRRPRRCRARTGRTCRTRSTTSTSGPARPSTC